MTNNENRGIALHEGGEGLIVKVNTLTKNVVQVKNVAFMNIELKISDRVNSVNVVMLALKHDSFQGVNTGTMTIAATYQVEGQPQETKTLEIMNITRAGVTEVNNHDSVVVGISFLQELRTLKGLKLYQIAMF